MSDSTQGASPNPLSVNLDTLYRNAWCLKREVYQCWVDNLSVIAMVADPSQRAEALRRIDYIETELMCRPDKWRERIDRVMGRETVEEDEEGEAA